jgi:hypothetical protein
MVPSIFFRLLTLLVNTKLGMKIYHRQQGSLERFEKALKRLECPSKLVKRCHNKAGKGLRHVERLDGKAGWLSVCPTGASPLRLELAKIVRAT